MEEPGDEVLNLSGREAVWGAQPGILTPVCRQHNKKIGAGAGRLLETAWEHLLGCQFLEEVRFSRAA